MAKEAQIRVNPSSLLLSAGAPTYIGAVLPSDFIPEPMPEPSAEQGEVMLIGVYGIPISGGGVFGPSLKVLPVVSGWEFGIVGASLPAGKLREVRFRIVADSGYAVGVPLSLRVIQGTPYPATVVELAFGPPSTAEAVWQGSIDWPEGGVLAFEVVNSTPGEGYTYVVTGALTFVPTLPAVA